VNALHERERVAADETLAAVRTIAVALEAYVQDHGALPVRKDVVAVDDIAPLLEPTYVRELPRVDGSGRRIAYAHAVGDGDSLTIVLGEGAEATRTTCTLPCFESREWFEK
jgi:hypothetical protein